MSASNNQYSTEFTFGQDGWPINSKTGQSFTRDEIVINPAIPYPIDVDEESDYWARRTPEALAVQKASIAKKAAARNRRTARQTSTCKPTRYTGFAVSSASQLRDSAYRATAELVDRVNGNAKADNEILFTAGGHTRTLVVYR
jgi:hypothetical protein